MTPTTDCTCYYCGAEKVKGENCPECEKGPKVITKAASPYERTRTAVYAAGNKWAIENFNATHN